MQITSPIVMSILLCRGAFCQTSPGPKVPAEVAALQGVYTGSWASYGVDANGKVVKRASWTDTMKAGDATVEGGRAFVATIGEMVFDGGRPPAMKIKGEEGYVLNRDGTLGEYFIKTFGQEYRMRKLDGNVWTYAAGASPQELAQSGFSNVRSGQHVVVKVVNQEDGKETHRITRVTTVNWTDTGGKSRWLQFVSLEGVHRRQ